MIIGIVGLGLIGGSFAKAIKKRTEHQVFGSDIHDPTLKIALEEHSIDFPLEPSNFHQCDIILLSLYPEDIIQFLEEHLPLFSKRTIIIDLCGVKSSICDFAKEIFNEVDGPFFIGGHPMAGREFSGYDASIPDLFQNASMILTPDESLPAKQLETARRFFLSLGFSRIVLSTPEHHDRVIAYTSQLAHIVSNAYVQSPTARAHMGFSAGSFDDLTRVAKLNPSMWTQLFLENKEPLIKEIDTILEHLQEFKAYILQDAEQKLYDKLSFGSSVKEKLNQQSNEMRKQTLETNTDPSFDTL